MAALSSTLSLQKVQYDFQYHPIEFYADFPSLIISTAPKSLLPCDCLVPLVPVVKISPENIPDRPHLQPPLNPSILNLFRDYIAICASIEEYSVDADVQKVQIIEMLFF